MAERENWICVSQLKEKIRFLRKDFPRLVNVEHQQEFLGLSTQAAFAKYFQLGTASRLTNWITGSGSKGREYVPPAFERAVALRYGFAPSAQFLGTAVTGSRQSSEVWDKWFVQCFPAWRNGNVSSFEAQIRKSMVSGGETALHIHSANSVPLREALSELAQTNRPRRQMSSMSSNRVDWNDPPFRTLSAVLGSGEFGAVAREAATAAGIRAGTELEGVINQALSNDREIRRQAHIAIMNTSTENREAFLRAMRTLLTCPESRVRGEAVYCLGSIPRRSHDYAISQEELCRFLGDDELFVRNCAANVARNFIPLEDELVQRLNDVLLLGVPASQNPLVSNGVYYASVALWTDRAFKLRGAP